MPRAKPKKPAKKSAGRLPRRAVAPALPIDPTGRKFGPEVRAKIIAALDRGATQRLAAELAGVDERSVKRWLAQGRECLAERETWDRDGQHGDPPALDGYAVFVLEVAQARARADFDLIDVITQACRRGDWRAALALLGRRRPAEFGEHLAVSGAVVDDESGERLDATDDLLARLTKAAQRTRGEGADGDGDDTASGG